MAHPQHRFPCALTLVVTLVCLSSAQPIFKPPPDDKCVCKVSREDDSALQSEVEQLKIAVNQLSEKIEPTQELLHQTKQSIQNFTTGLQQSTTLCMTTTTTPTEDPALACQGPVTSFSGRQTIRAIGDNGVLLRDHSSSSDNTEKAWYLPKYSGNTIEEYRTMDDFAVGNVVTTYRLPGSAGSGGMAWWGHGHVIYNNCLYYQRFPDCMSYSYDCSNEKAQIVRYDLGLRAFTALQSLPTIQLSHWVDGPTYVYLAVDDRSVWAIGSNNGLIHLTKLNANHLGVEDIIDTEYTIPGSHLGSNIPPFIACGKFYSIVPDSTGSRMYGTSIMGARATLILDLTTKQKDTTQAWYCLPVKSRRYFSFNSRENKLYAIESGALVSYNATVGGSYHTDLVACAP
ncbi:noelin-like [Branchiostoma floridae]|uniref:Noelin-like n=1 Tax=Branchiostoma floridae TaxID=7739 RepID=A0A9J7M8G5_BRAFL|nr:noelin-like [Branchiostoma floridae]